MPQRLLLGDGTEHIVGEPVADEPGEDALEDAHKALESDTAEAPEPEITPCRTAFTVYLDEDGEVCLSETAWASPAPERPATFDEMTHAASVAQLRVADYSWQAPYETCLTAFTPYLTHDGRWLISADPNDPLVVDRQPTNDEIHGGLAVVLRDLQTQEILQIVVNQVAPAIVQSTTQSVLQNLPQVLMQFGEAVKTAGQNAAIAEKLEADKHRRGGR